MPANDTATNAAPGQPDPILERAIDKVRFEIAARREFTQHLPPSLRDTSVEPLFDLIASYLEKAATCAQAGDTDEAIFALASIAALAIEGVTVLEPGLDPQPHAAPKGAVEEAVQDGLRRGMSPLQPDQPLGRALSNHYRLPKEEA